MEEDHRPTSEAHLEERCDICGDIGVSDAINTCPRCKISCEHIYCMRASVGHPQKDWCCDDCRRSNEILSPSGTTDDLARGSPLCPAGWLRQNSVRPNNQPHDSRQNGIDRAKKIPPGKVKYIHTEEVIMLSSGAKKSGFPVKLTCSSNPISWKNAASALDKTPVKHKAIPAKSSMHIVRANPLVTSKQLKPLRPKNSQMNVVSRQHLTQSFKGLREKGTIQAPLEGHMQKEQSKDKFRNTAEIRVEKAISKTASASSAATCGQASVDAGGDAFPDVELQRTDPKFLKCSTGPALDASWKGSFKIYIDSRFGEMIGVQAYPPSRVRKKVLEFSKLMPEVLQFELVPHRDIWANLFQNYCLDRGDIGLYFFPVSIERCGNYISLLEVMGAEDLAMRNLMDGVELFIFTSKVLCLDCQKWKGRHFLWGVYHSLRKAKKHASQVDDAREFHVKWDSNQDIDMEIDMMAGEEVGRMDVAVPRESLQLVSSTLDVIAASSKGCDDMEIDMMGGEEVGRMDVAVSSKSMQVLPLSIDATDSRKACHDVPPGFENIFMPIKIESPDLGGQNIGTLSLKNHSSDNFSKPIASQRPDPGRH